MPWLKNAGLVFVGVIILFIVIRVTSWVTPPDVHTVTVPKDTTFTPVEHQTYQPPSLPFTGKHSPVRLPSNVSEKDVERVVTVETDSAHPVNIIETKDGEVYVAKDSTVKRITVTTFTPPLFSFGLRFGAGLSVAKRGNQAALSPVGVFAPIEWSGWLHAPIGTVDFDGIGVGAQTRVYHDIFLGLSKVAWKFEGGDELKLTASFMF